MESLLNSVWLLVVTAILCLWYRFGQRHRDGQRTSLIAMAMLVVTLFPVISVSDDLWSIQNPAEADTCHRRDLLAPSHSLLPVFALPPEPIFAGLRGAFQRLNMAERPCIIALDSSILEGIENRPPPGEAV